MGYYSLEFLFKKTKCSITCDMDFRFVSSDPKCFCTIGKYGYLRNVHGTFITYIHNVEHKEHRNLEIRKHVTTSCSGTKPFYQLWVKRFRHKEGRHNLAMPSYSFGPYLVRHPRGANSPASASSQKSNLLVWCLASNSLTFFKSPKNLRALPVRDVTRTPSPRSVISGYCDIFCT